jgi:bacteriocin-like protein
MKTKSSFETIETKSLKNVTGGCGACAGGNCGGGGAGGKRPGQQGGGQGEQAGQ